MTNRLSRDAWIAAGLAALANDGVESVRVATLATALGVTKGSFYWHFRDRQELLDAMLETWTLTGTREVIDAVEAEGGSARQRLHRLFMLSLEADGRLNLAIRAWANGAPRVATVLETVTRRRIAYVDRLFREIGFAPAEASARARFAFQALVGHYALGANSTLTSKDRSEFETIFKMLVRKSG